MISYKAPELCQLADEDLLLVMGEVVFPGFVRRQKGENGLRLWVEGVATDDSTRATAGVLWQTLLGLLRAQRPVAGQLREEQRTGLGQAAARDENGNQWLMVGPAIEYSIIGDEPRRYAENAATAINSSQNLRNALWLNGGPNRTSSDFYMVHEYARRDLGGEKGIASSLGLSRNEQERLTRSANNLSPLDGGRHATGNNPAPWSLSQQQEFIAALLRRWIDHLALRQGRSH